jgi:hypothetical protein
MRALACSLLFSIYLFARNYDASRLFPIPEGLDKTWPDAVLSDSEKKLLREAVEPDLRDLEGCGDEKPTFESLVKTSIALGRLGKGVLVAPNRRCYCGGTGNCPVYLYVREKDRYREVLRNGKRVPYSWAFAVVNSQPDIPEIVLATNSSARQVNLTKYRYVGDRFFPQACETLTAKNTDSGPKSWWDPDQVLIRPCEKY